MRRRMKLQRLKQAWTNPLETGIFTQLQTKGVPWASLNMSGSLNLIYHFNRSGNKIISPLVESYTDNEDALTAVDKSAIGDALVTIYNDKWQKLYELLSLEYDPISNYDMEENETISGENNTETKRTGTDTTTGTGTNTITHEGTETEENTGTQTTTHTGTEQNTNTGTQTNAHTGTQGVTGSETTEGDGEGATDNTVYGFNSIAGVKDSASENQNHAETTKTSSDTRTDNLTDTRTDALTATRTDNLTDTRTDALDNEKTVDLTDTETRNITDQTTHNTTDTTTGENETIRRLTRKGNIGVTTSQQMIQSSIDLWQWNFFTQVFEDIDTLLTIATY